MVCLQIFAAEKGFQGLGIVAKSHLTHSGTAESYYRQQPKHRAGWGSSCYCMLGNTARGSTSELLLGCESMAVLEMNTGHEMHLQKYGQQLRAKQLPSCRENNGVPDLTEL